MLRVLQVVDAVRGSAGAEGLLHAEGRGAVAHARAAVDVVGAHLHAEEFLHEVVLLVRAARAAHAGQRIGSVLLHDVGEAVHDEVIGFVPGAGNEFAVLPDQRCAQALRVIIEVERITALQARMPLVRFGIVGRGDGDDLVVFDLHLQVAAHTAISTHAAHHFIGLRLLALEHIGDGARGAGLRTGAATHTIALEEALVRAFGDVAVETATGHGEHEFTLHFITGPHAAVAADTGAEVADHIGMRRVHLHMLVRLAFGVAHAIDVKTDLLNDVVELVRAVVLGLQPLRVVVGEHQLDDVLPQPLHARAVGGDVHALADGRVARGHDFRRTIFLQGDFHGTHPAAAEGLQVRCVAKRRHRVRADVPAHEGQHRFVLVDGIGHAVDVGDVDLGGYRVGRGGSTLGAGRRGGGGAVLGGGRVHGERRMEPAARR